nr:hypothetical protein [Elusimicrobiota bacterium]
MNTAKNKRLNYLLNQAITIFDLLDISPVLAEILSLSEVKLDDEAKTAHISKGKNGYSIKFSPEFFKVCDYPYKFAGVLLHEIFHGFYRDFTRFKIIKPVVNLGMDAIINSTIHRLDPRLTKIFSDFYSADRFPEQFLRPGSNPKGEGEIRIYNLLWTDQDIGITLDDLIIFFNQRISWNTDVIFLGTHGDRLEKIPYSKTIIDGVKARIGGENKFSEHISEQIVDKSNKIPSCSVSLNQIFKYAAGSTTTNNHYYYNTIVPKTLKLHKKDLLCLSQNIWPLYFKESGNRSKVHLYLDVSASVKYLLPGLYEMLKRYNKFLCR